VQPTKPIADAIGEESKPELAAKRPPKTAQAIDPNCTIIRGCTGLDRETVFIEAGPTGEISGLGSAVATTRRA